MSGMTQSQWRWCWQFSVCLLVMGGAITLRSPSLGIARSNSPREYLGSCMKRCNPLFWLGGGISLFCLVTSSPVQAQIVRDRTVGTIVNNPSGNIFEITGGTPAGSNLFHSFEKFSVPNGDVVRFINNNLNIQNVISRVTGQGPAYISNINGVIAAGGAAPNFNLFLLNPNGILFGPNAQLNIGGSFVATTANGIKFGNQRFIASTSQDDVSLLTVNPSALLFNQIAANSITSQARLQVPNGQSLLLVGGNVSLDGGVLNAPGGRVELGSIAGVGAIDLTVDGNDLYLNSFPDSIARADVSLLNGANVDVVSSGGGSIAIYARNLDVFTGGTALSAGIGSGSGSPGAQAGDITLNATGAFRIGRSSFITNEVRPLGIGNSGDIKIYSGSFSLIEDARLVASTSGQGQAGNVLIETANSVSFVTGAIFSNVEAGGVGNGGNITINAKSLSLTDGAELQTVLREASDTLPGGRGKAGNVNINVQDTVTIAGVNFRGYISKVFTEVNPGAVGDGGDINITARSVYLLDGAGLTTKTQSQGNAGNIRINATDVVEISGVNALSNARTSLSTNTTTDGKGGDITINTRILTIRNGAGVFADTSGAGRAGTLAVNANSVEVIGTSPNGQLVSGLYFDTSSGGNAGELKINTGQLVIRDGGRVSASTSDQGQAGILTVQADLVEVSGTSADRQDLSQLFFDSSSAGNAGELTITTNRLVIQGGGRVSAATAGSGRGGILAVNASDSVEVSGISINNQLVGGLYFDSRSTGDARGISIKTGRLGVQNGGQVTVSGSGSGSAGDLQITAGSISLNNQGKLQATNTSGAGSIRINTGELTVQNGSQVTVSGTGSGVSGNLEVKADSIFMNNQSNLTAITESGEGGNIRLQVDDTVLLRYNSNILTEALGTGNGGNITINAGGFVLAILPENSDVAATAIQGRGGNIFVTAQGVFGFSLPERLVRTPESDISAASQLGINGTREIDTGNQPQPEALPDEPLPELIEPRCQVGRRQANSEFIISGRGGLPPNPSQTLSSNTGWVDLRSSASGTENTSSSALPMKPTGSAPTQLVEAQGWIVNDKGEVELTASAPSATLYSSWQTPKACPAQNENVEK